MCQSNLMGKESFMKIVLGINVNWHHLTWFINSIENIGVNIKAKPIEFLEENTGISLCDPGLDNGFLDTTPKA